MRFLRCGWPCLRPAHRRVKVGRSRYLTSINPYHDSRFFTTVKARQTYHHATRQDDTIYALSTAAGRAAIAIIRISGPACLNIYNRLCPNQRSPKPRTATLRKLLSSDDESILDPRALILYFPAPHTVTGEEVLELHIHGGPAIVRSVLEAIPRAASLEFGGAAARPAEAGEFTKRAFYNDRIDLTEVEALGEALTAETEQQRRLAVSGAASGLTQRYEEWRSMLLHARAELEALIDFSEDQYFDESPAEFIRSVSNQILDLKSKLELHVQNANRGELLRSGINVALLGPPNAGKSSLLNRIVGREAAIVSTEEGTTRDIVDVCIDIGGWLVRLGDMAGVRAAFTPVLRSSIAMENSQTMNSVVGQIEQEGIRRARQRALESDLVIVLVPLELKSDGAATLVVNDELLDAVQQCRTAGKAMLFVLNKIDILYQQTDAVKGSLSRLLSQALDIFPNTSPHDVFCISCWDADKTNLDGPDPGGLQTFVSGLTNKFSSMTSALVSQTQSDNVTSSIVPAEAQSYWTSSLSITHRQSTLLKECLDHVAAYLETTSTASNSAAERISHTRLIDNIETIRSLPQDQRYFDVEDLISSGQPSVANDKPGYHVDNHQDIVGVMESGIVTSPGQMHSDADRGLRAGEDIEIDIVAAAEHLRYAADCLARLVGRDDGTTSGADVEDVLGVIFER